MIDYTKLPTRMQDTARLYVEQGTPGGSFFTAVVSNNFTQAVLKADDANAAAMRDWVMWLYNEAPSGCQGSPENVDNWVKAGGLNGIVRHSLPRTSSGKGGCYTGHPSYDQPTGHGSWKRNG